MNVAVTGGSGVVGSAVVRHLVDAGHEVKALARSDASAARLASLGAKAMPGDVLDKTSLDRLVEGCQWVFHVAGVNELCSPDPGRLQQVNVEGTRLVVRACREQGVARMIHTSSGVTIGEEQGVLATEDTPHRGWYLSDYERSKTEAERVLIAEANGLDVVAVNPSSVQGPGRATGTGRLFLDAARGRLRFLIDTTISVVDIDDCARGHLRAAERGEPGQRYLLSGATLTTGEALAALAEVTGVDPAPRFLPVQLANAAAAVVEGASKLARRRPLLCREMIRVMRFGHRYDGSKATRELGLDYTPIEVTIRRAIEWFRSEGLL